MQPIPPPHVLDPDRLLQNDRADLTADHESRARLLDGALRETCGYAEQLWQVLGTAREYLLTSLPPDPRVPSQAPTTSASPTGPDDEAGWKRWMSTYADVTAVLCGPHGDSGFGLAEAHREAQLRRDAPVVHLQQRLSASVSAPPAAPAAGGVTTTAQPWSRAARAAATGVLVVLAARGLRPRHR